ncbi:5676_t:CDS:2 [Paraglomus occultum]|uniref:5676_t:CDS:1 n=1 Tax=Paraglomus occultum TaxID=144539 RepID=A0A9N9FHB9_9GLOM|nr:5676_t:CDS:2 [Paraglomus occultum]
MTENPARAERQTPENQQQQRNNRRIMDVNKTRRQLSIRMKSVMKFSGRSKDASNIKWQDPYNFLGLLNVLDQASVKSSKGALPSLEVVMGNESADLDSIISATAYAVLTNILVNKICIPLVQISKSELKLRQECVYALKESGLNQNNLIYLDDFEKVKKVLKKYDDSKIVLVDHNQLMSRWKDVEGKVYRIIDHHKDENLYSVTGEYRNIKLVGSACSLVTLEFKDLWTKATDDQKKTLAKLPKLLLAPILVDTISLDESKGKTKPEDLSAAKFLLEIISDYHGIQKARFDVSHLSDFDLLRKDYKQWEIASLQLGISAVTWDLNSWTEARTLEKVTESFDKYAERNKLDLLLVATLYDHPEYGFQRELVIWPVGEKIDRKQLVEKLKDSELRLVNNGKYKHNAFYNQENVVMSRKQIYPLVETILRSMDGWYILDQNNFSLSPVKAMECIGFAASQ